MTRPAKADPVKAWPPPPPEGLGAPGAEAWVSVVSAYRLRRHELLLLRHIAEIEDSCATLGSTVDAEGHLGEDGKIHPALVELRQQRLLLAKLFASLRVPIGPDAGGEPSDQGGAAATPRTQHRGPRGVYGPRPVS